MIQARNVDAGMSGSSKLATAERTSGYGESSSARKQEPELHGEGKGKVEGTNEGVEVGILIVQLIDLTVAPGRKYRGQFWSRGM